MVKVEGLPLPQRSFLSVLLMRHENLAGHYRGYRGGKTVSEASTQGPHEQEPPANEQGPRALQRETSPDEETWMVLLVACVVMVVAILAGILGVL